MDLERIRSDFPALSNYTWFQNGGVSITPRPVAEEHIRLMRELLERGPMHTIYPEEEYPRRIRTKDRLGEFFNVEGGDLALMRGVSEGFQTILRGRDWKEGDHVLMTAEEEAALFLPTLHLRDLFGVKVDKIPLVNDLQGQVDAVEELITDRTRLIAFSHVITDSGFRLPCKEICHLARERGILTFADMAHSAGLYPMDLYEEGCDFAGLLSYKWMYAPYASGALFVRKERLDDIRVTYAGGRAEAWADWVKDKFKLKSSAERFESGPWSWPLIHAWACSMDYLSGIGLDKIWDRTVLLTSRLKSGLTQIPGVTLFTPEAPELSAAVQSFHVAGWEVDDVKTELQSRWNIELKAFKTTHHGLRASCPFFLLEEEVDRLLEAIRTLAGEKG